LAARAYAANMADSDQSDQERTLEPSAKRLAEARREGQVPRSRHLAHLLMLGCAAFALFLFADSLLADMRAVLARGLTFDATTVREPARMGARLGELAGNALLAVAPMLLLLLTAACVAPLAVGGWLFSPHLAAPRFGRMNPMRGIGRMFSLQAAAELGKVMLVAVLIGAVGFGYISTHVEEFAALAGMNLSTGMVHFGRHAGVAFLLLVGTIAAAAAIDVPLQIFTYRKQLRMTPEQAKREAKEADGDPLIKGRIRQAQRAMARKRMMAAVPKADVIVTNPTHFAVALKYMEERHRAPLVVAKGSDDVAERIKELGRENSVPLLEAPPLARALYKHVEIGAEIPATLYSAVAQVLAYVFQLQRFARGTGPRPSEPHDIEVPPGMDPLEPRAKA
jgi:flagellar biosynthetic protein FlhB